MKKLIAILCALMLVLLCVSCAKKPAEQPEASVEQQSGEAVTEEKTEAPEEKPEKDEPAEKPSKDTPAEKPSKDTPAEKPSKDAPAEKPSKDTPAEKPSKDTPAEKPSKDTPVEKPSEEASKPAPPVVNKTNALQKDDLLMYVTDSFVVGGTNEVLKVKVENGTLRTGDSVRIYYNMKRNKSVVAKVEGIAMFRKPISSAVKGDEVEIKLSTEFDTALNSQVAKGAAVVAQDSRLKPAKKFNGTFRVKADAPNAVTNPNPELQVQVLTGYGREAYFDSLKAPVKGQSCGGNFIFLSDGPVLYVGQELQVSYQGRVCGTFTVDTVFPDFNG